MSASSQSQSGKPEVRWLTVQEAAERFRRSQWLIRKTAHEMSALKFPGHPIKAGRWLIDAEAMESYFSLQAERAASETHYPVSDGDGRVRSSDEDWGW